MFYYRLSYLNDFYEPPRQDERSGIVEGNSFSDAMKNLEDWYGKEIISIEGFYELDPVVETVDFKDIFPDL